MTATNIDEFPNFNVCELIQRQCAATPDATACIVNGEEFSYADLDARANAIAERIVECGAVSSDLIGVCVERSLDMVASVIAVMRCGCAYVPLDPEFPQSRLAQMISDSELSTVVTQGKLEKLLSACDVEHLLLDDISTASANKSFDPIDPRSLAYVIYTSGSTGEPKGVCIEHRNLTNFIFAMAERSLVRRDDRLLAVTTLSFDIAALELFLPLVMGGTIALADDDQKFDGAQLAALIETHDANVMQATPSTWRLLLEAGWGGGDEFRALCGGEAMPADIARDLSARCGEVWNMYGPTETTVWSTCYRIPPNGAPVLIGRPIANTEIYILDKAGRQTPLGIPGEIFIGGAGVASGYLNNAVLTDERFLDDPFKANGEKIYRTGDFGRMLPSGDLEFRNRIDDQVKIRGYRIELGDIEHAITQSGIVEQAICAVVELAAGDKRLIAYCRVKNGTRIDIDAIRDHTLLQLPGYMIPQHFVEIEKFPLTPNGKVDRRALPMPNLQNMSARQYAPPETMEERVVAEIAANIFDIEKVSITANFFEVGGHSLLAMRLLSQLRMEVCSTLKIRDIFEAENFRDLAQKIATVNSRSATEIEEFVF